MAKLKLPQSYGEREKLAKYIRQTLNTYNLRKEDKPKMWDKFVVTKEDGKYGHLFNTGEIVTLLKVFKNGNLRLLVWCAPVGLGRIAGALFCLREYYTLIISSCQ